jgi:hypothetical protein
VPSLVRSRVLGTLLCYSIFTDTTSNLSTSGNGYMIHAAVRGECVTVCVGQPGVAVSDSRESNEVSLLVLPLADPPPGSRDFSGVGDLPI